MRAYCGAVAAMIAILHILGSETFQFRNQLRINPYRHRNLLKQLRLSGIRAVENNTSGFQEGGCKTPARLLARTSTSFSDKASQFPIPLPLDMLRSTPAATAEA